MREERLCIYNALTDKYERVCMCTANWRLIHATRRVIDVRRKKLRGKGNRSGLYQATTNNSDKKKIGGILGSYITHKIVMQ